ASPPAACASPARCSTGSATRRRRDSGRFFGIRSPSPGDRFFGFNPSSTVGPLKKPSQAKSASPPFRPSTLGEEEIPKDSATGEEGKAKEGPISSNFRRN